MSRVLSSEHVDRALQRLGRECSGTEVMAGCGFVYVLRWHGHERVKIGRSDNHPAQRLMDLQMSSPAPLEVVAIGHWSLVEKIIHKRFAASRRHGEWFDIDRTELRSFVAGRDGLCFGCAEKVELAARTPGFEANLGTRNASWRPHTPSHSPRRNRLTRYVERWKRVEQALAENDGDLRRALASLDD